ncbi:hypothetical protein HAHE_12260 [Haloferula helveola]|uniref:Uncharacterized protein n=1 Tax=Haloferula helveola TaxID=490095 RepID=A0ABM7R8F8_9BACT|nr:hypothetical protein HAHE_12260 [Haloferula helveola]
MKLRWLPIGLGVAHSVYWLLAFATVIFTPLRFPGVEIPWWDLAALRLPGLWLMNLVAKGFERLGFDFYWILDHGMGWFVATLVITTLGIGAGTWLITQVILTRILAYRSRRKPAPQ